MKPFTVVSTVWQFEVTTLIIVYVLSDKNAKRTLRRLG